MIYELFQRPRRPLRPEKVVTGEKLNLHGAVFTPEAIHLIALVQRFGREAGVIPFSFLNCPDQLCFFHLFPARDPFFLAISLISRIFMIEPPLS
jgi:hypothetical protein